MPTFQIPSKSSQVPIAPVGKGDTWSFSARGRWVDWWIPCGPDGYRNFLADLLDIEPRVPDHPWFYLMGEVHAEDGTVLETVPIGKGGTHTFARSGTLVVFANDALNMYWNNKHAITLQTEPHTGLPIPECDDPALYAGFLGGWRLFRRTLERTQGALFVLLLLLIPSLVLTFVSQGQDLVRGLSDNNLRMHAIFLAASLLFLGTQGWFWTRLIVTSNYGVNRASWRPRWLLEWGPRGIGLIPFIGMVASLLATPDRRNGLVFALVGLGVLFFVFLILRRDLANRLTPNLGTRYYAVFGLIAALFAMIAVVVAPVWFGWTLGPPAVVLFGLGLIIPPVVIVIQSGAALRLPTVLLMLVWAAVIGLYMDNHHVGRRAFVHEMHDTDFSKRVSLEDAYAHWKSKQGPAGSDGYTMVLVAAEGGASRAGYWTANVLAALNSIPQGSFARHTFAINSVSGGSVGAVGYTAMLHDGAVAGSLKDRLLGFAKEDALSPTLAEMFYPDLLQRFWPVPFLPDRAEGLERAWEEAWSLHCDTGSEACTKLMAGPFLDLGPAANGPWSPIPIVQGAGEESGRRILTSKLKLAPSQLDADDFYEITGSDVPVSTAIHNGARFPWVSPAGTLMNGGDRQGHILDGGYFDTAGVETVRELVEAVKNGPAKAANDKIRFVVVSIAYDEATKKAQPKPAETSAPPSKRAQATGNTSSAWRLMNEVVAPLVGLFASRDAHGAHLRRELKLSADGAWNMSDGTDPFTQAPDTPADDANPSPADSVVYVPVMMCAGTFNGKDFKPTMDWVLSDETQHFIDDTIKGAAGACPDGSGVEAPTKAIGALVKLLSDADGAADKGP